MKMRNKPYLIALSFMFLCVGFSHGQKKTWTLQEAIEHAVENNVQIIEFTVFNMKKIPEKITDYQVPGWMVG